MNSYYLIVCKNDFPPVDKYTIYRYETFDEIPLKYRKRISSGAEWNLNKIFKVDEELIFLGCEEDPVTVMINFWGAYMYSVPGEGRG